MDDYNTTWDLKKSKEIKTPKKMLEFFTDLKKLYKKYDFSISHEDGHGAFIIENFDEENVRWIENAFKNYKRRKKNE